MPYQREKKRKGHHQHQSQSSKNVININVGGKGGGGGGGGTKKRRTGGGGGNPMDSLAFNQALAMSAPHTNYVPITNTNPVQNQDPVIVQPQVVQQDNKPSFWDMLEQSIGFGIAGRLGASNVSYSAPPVQETKVVQRSQNPRERVLEATQRRQAVARAVSLPATRNTYVAPASSTFDPARHVLGPPVPAAVPHVAPAHLPPLPPLPHAAPVAAPHAAPVAAPHAEPAAVPHVAFPPLPAVPATPRATPKYVGSGGKDALNKKEEMRSLLGDSDRSSSVPHQREAGKSIWSRVTDLWKKPSGYERLPVDPSGVELQAPNKPKLQTPNEDRVFKERAVRDKALGFEILEKMSPEDRIDFYQETIKNAKAREHTDEKDNKVIPFHNKTADTYHFLHEDGNYIQRTKEAYDELIARNADKLPPTTSSLKAFDVSSVPSPSKKFATPPKLPPPPERKKPTTRSTTAGRNETVERKAQGSQPGGKGAKNRRLKELAA
jgi:hypothetical protein